jgi:hypothetical protein
MLNANSEASDKFRQESELAFQLLSSRVSPTDGQRRACVYRYTGDWFTVVGAIILRSSVS